jgi:hypothetical protein
MTKLFHRVTDHSTQLVLFGHSCGGNCIQPDSPSRLPIEVLAHQSPVHGPGLENSASSVVTLLPVDTGRRASRSNGESMNLIVTFPEEGAAGTTPVLYTSP